MAGRHVLGMLVTVVLGAVLAGCARSGPPAPESGYRAVVSVSTRAGPDAPRRSSRFEEFYSQGKRRRQAVVEGRPIVQIDRPDLRVSWILDPQARSFAEHRLSSRQAIVPPVPNPFGPRSSARFVATRIEPVDGVEARAYSVDGDAITGMAWLSLDGVPLRFRGTLDVGDAPVGVEVVYHEIERGPQAGFLFAVPPTYPGYADRKQKKRSEGPDVQLGEAIRSVKREWYSKPSRTW